MITKMSEINTKELAEEFCDMYISMVDYNIWFVDRYRDGEIAPCCPQRRECHILTGLMELAELLEVELFRPVFEVEDVESQTSQMWEESVGFYYRGVLFFEIME